MSLGSRDGREGKSGGRERILAQHRLALRRQAAARITMTIRLIGFC
jgi:hypothetical protein